MQHFLNEVISLVKGKNRKMLVKYQFMEELILRHFE